MILVTGATGFVGSHLVKGLVEAGHSVKALSRDVASAARVKGPGVTVAVGDVSDIESLTRAAEGCDTVIHLVGIIQEGPGFTFESVHVQGTGNMIEAAKRAGGVKHFIYQSALGTTAAGKTGYYRTKWAAEEMTRASGLNYSITRPSIIYGRGDGFTRKLIDVIKLSPVMPVMGNGRVKMQPLFIGDLVKALVKISGNPDWFGKTLELGGPEQMPLDRIVDEIMDALGRRRPTVHMPIALMRPAAFLMERVMSTPPITNGQLTMLEEDNVCSLDDLRALGVEPVRFHDGLRTFLP
ncbi:MAG TPA: complex I NDUFA9 subunit family protein [Nitrospirota bacterium]|jgi:NADH dehydrogenase